MFTKHLGYDKIIVGALPIAQFLAVSGGYLAFGGCYLAPLRA